MGKDSDVYLVSMGEYYQCVCCRFTPMIILDMHDSSNFDTIQQVLDHLDKHIAAGHKVPEYAFKRLKEEL